LTERANSARVGLISKVIDFDRLTDEGALTKSVHMIGAGLPAARPLGLTIARWLSDIANRLAAVWARRPTMAVQLLADHSCPQ